MRNIKNYSNMKISEKYHNQQVEQNEAIEEMQTLSIYLNLQTKEQYRKAKGISPNGIKYHLKSKKAPANFELCGKTFVCG